MSKKSILICNDDGITAKGIRSLIEVAKEFGDIYIVAPNSPQSAQGHAITMEEPIRIYPVNIFGEEIEAYECSGTPVDCIKLAKHLVLKNINIDLCVSGINHGSNASSNIIYSGTMSAAMEASIEGIPAIGFSLLDYAEDADFETSKHVARQLIGSALEHGLGDTNLLNVNIPQVPLSELKGIKVCRQAEGHWAEEFMEGKDPIGRPYYWLSGKYVLRDKGEDSDIWALRNGYVSVVPVIHDLTHHPAIPSIKHLEQL